MGRREKAIRFAMMTLRLGLAVLWGVSMFYVVSSELQVGSDAVFVLVSNGRVGTGLVQNATATGPHILRPGGVPPIPIGGLASRPGVTSSIFSFGPWVLGGVLTAAIAASP